jgi:hypothetical protein
MMRLPYVPTIAEALAERSVGTRLDTSNGGTPAIHPGFPGVHEFGEAQLLCGSLPSQFPAADMDPATSCATDARHNGENCADFAYYADSDADSLDAAATSTSGLPKNLRSCLMKRRWPGSDNVGNR